MPERTVPFELRSLCVAAKHAVGALGTVAQVSQVIGKSPAQISRMTSINEPDMLTIADVARIEEMTVGTPGWPHVTTALALLTGHRLVPIEHETQRRDDWIGLVARLLGGSSALGREILDDFSNDGRLDLTELRRIKALLDVERAVLADADRMVQAAMDAEGGR